MRRRKIVARIVAPLVVVLVAGLALAAWARTYVVQPGDSLWSIGQLYQLAVQALQGANGLPDHEIQPGQKLQVPDDTSQPDFAPLRQRMLAYLSQQPQTYAVYFQDLISGRSFGINDTEPMWAASTIKVPLVLYINQLAAQGDLDWQEKLAYQADDYQGGAGILQFSAHPGDRYSLRVLANLSITVSDNIAARMLMRFVGKDSLAAYMRQIGGELVFPDGQNLTTARDMGAYIRAVLAFRDQNPALGGRLLDDMANSIYHVGLPGKLPQTLTVAHKEGDLWAGGADKGVADDVGVVFGSRPYILVVLSKGWDDPEDGFPHIAELSRLAYDYEEAQAQQG
ncbi:MAG: serine hydrolase [Firmicutes bacterium]|nr:serine hydrolase [Bacillota bacterium]